MSQNIGEEIVILNEGVFSCKYLQGRLQVLAGTDASTYGNGCSALRGRLQCTASERGKAGTEIVSPILDKRKGREKGLYMEHCSPQIISAEPKIF